MNAHTGGGNIQLSIVWGSVFAGPRLEIAFGCSECGGLFSQVGSLKLHMNAHAESWAIQLFSNVGVFSQARNLELHMKAHTGDEAFGCSVCGKLLYGQAT